MTMDADSVLAALREMASDTVPKSKSKEQKLAEIKTPEVKAPDVKLAVAPPGDDDNEREDVLPGLIPVVVLDDGSTFSNIEGARIVMVFPSDEEISEAAYESGVPIKGLVDLYNAIRGVVR
jgi:hypothetical protein